ncbi:MAG TPA: hypothetical protein VHV83_10170, partial [Armatimonadota bacterium]|nr:hypothetical protein [Armatimonadota bacterium]
MHSVQHTSTLTAHRYPMEPVHHGKHNTGSPDHHVHCEHLFEITIVIRLDAPITREHIKDFIWRLTSMKKLY